MPERRKKVLPEERRVVQKVLLLALAGAVGTLTRFGLSGIVRRYNTTPFPWGTFAVNMTGCFLVGILWALFESRRPLSPESRTIVLVGFMGAFTTFSAFILETGQLFRSSLWLHAGVNVILQNGFGFLALFLGAALGKNL